jgi:hypothetical protein
MSDLRELRVLITAITPPILTPGAAFGLQDQAQHLQTGTPTADGGLTYTCTLTLLHNPRLDALDFRGDYAHGRAGERFLYLSHGTLAADGRWTWHQRWKLMLNSLPPELIESAGAEGLTATIHQLSGTRPTLLWESAS